MKRFKKTIFKHYTPPPEMLRFQDLLDLGDFFFGGIFVVAVRGTIWLKGHVHVKP